MFHFEKPADVREKRGGKPVSVKSVFCCMDKYLPYFMLADGLIIMSIDKQNITQIIVTAKECFPVMIELLGPETNDGKPCIL